MISKKIQDVIKELKTLSLGKITKVSLPSEEEIKLYENELEFKFVDDYKYFLKEASNILYGSIDPCVLSKDMRGDLIVTAIEARQLGLPEKWLPICEDNSNYYCIDETGYIKYWAHDGAGNESWEDLASWIENVWLDKS